MLQTGTQTGWKFVGDEGTFSLPHADRTSHLYFPLANEAGMLSNVTPTLHGDIKSDLYSFLTPPVSVDDLHNSRSSRNFWLYAEGKGLWSAAGNSAGHNALKFGGHEETAEVEAGFLWHKTTRVNDEFGLRAEIVSFVPCGDDRVELMKVTVTNTGAAAVRITPTAAIPLYGRSADEIRDHRHVTSLLHRIYTSSHGIEIQPSLTFDERGHGVNRKTYGVFGATGEGSVPVGFFPVLEDFIGEGGTADWPEKAVRNAQVSAKAGAELEGFEAVGAIRFGNVTLAAGQCATFLLAMTITDDRADKRYFADKYLSAEKFEEHLDDNRRYWKEKLGTIAFQTGSRDFDLWMKWVTLQPILRRMYGNSFMPHHDYGRGGRGWRDLWQDCLALLVMEPEGVRGLLFNNFAGVRIDGTNATIIGAEPGEFKSDRNNIPRVWMDHGTWPFLTTLLYLNQSGDLGFLLQEQTYFKDAFIRRCKEKDKVWTPESGNCLLTEEGSVYRGTVLEHLLLQNLVHFFHVGEHNNIRLEDADWNDGMDMAPDKGESVAFTAFYGSNLAELGRLLLVMHERLGLDEIEVAEEIAPLFDTMYGPAADYESVGAKRGLLDRYYDTCPGRISGRKIRVDIRKAADDLQRKADWIADHLRKREWIESREGCGWFNGYYDNDGGRVEGDNPDGVRMTMTGQVFAVMGGIATDEQVGRIAASVHRYLKDPRIGYRLNSRFGGIQPKLGRAYGFAYGHKENGSMFSHMAVMYANALYKRGFAKEGGDVLASIYALCTDFATSRMYPGIPEYINEQGRGMYSYLTGSASWLLLTMLTEVYGVKGLFGDLRLEPKLAANRFDRTGMASVTTEFAGRKLHIFYLNPNNLDFGDYCILKVSIEGREVQCDDKRSECTLSRKVVEELAVNGIHTVEVLLG